MSLNDLFAVDTTVRLTPDTNTWADQIVSTLVNKYPSISKLVGEVIFSKVDATKGTAVGYISLIGKTQRIPFIIDEFELNPLDLYIDNGMYLPLSETSLSRLEKREWPFKLISQSERSTIIKTASLFEGSGDLKNSFITKHKEEIQKIASQFPELLEDLVTKISEKKQVPGDVVRFFIKEASSDKPIVGRNLSGPDKEYKLSEFAKLFGKEMVSKLMHEKEIFISSLPPVTRLMLDKKELLNSYNPSELNVGHYDHNGELLFVRKFEHCNISDLKQSAINPYIIITKDGQYFNSNKKLLRRGGDAAEISMKFHTDQPVTGDLCGFVLGERFYGPFRLDSIGSIGNDKIYTITDNELKKITIRTSDRIKSIVPLDNKNYLAGHYITLLKIVRGENKIVDDKAFLKTAASKVIINKKLNGKLNVNDGGLSGINNLNTKDLHKGDAKVALMKSGLSETDANYVIMKAMEDQSYSFDMPAKTAQVNSEVDESPIVKDIVNQCEDSNLLKVAVITGDKSNIDLALGLNLLTYNNVKRFKLLVPEIYKMLDRICKLLVIKRMNRGMFQINETEFTQAIFALENIATALGSL